jgi:mannitol 2-dehydrogenase
VLPSLQVAVDSDAPRAHLVLAVAAWMRYLRGTDDAGRDLEITDALAEELRELAELGGTDPQPLLDRADLFGGLAASARLASELAQALTALEHGALAAAAALDGGADDATDGQAA